MIGRIQSRSDFLRVRTEGVHIRSGLLSCTMFVDSSYSEARVGYVLGRAFGSAVSRNRVRRQLRALMQGHGNTMRPGVYVFGASPRAKHATFGELAADLDRLVAKCAERGQS